MNRLTPLILALALVGCQTTGNLDENSPFRVLPTGSHFLLKQELTIPAHSAGVMIQNGQVVNASMVNQYHPHCRLEVNDVRNTTQSVTTDDFVVRRVRQDMHMVSGPGQMPTGLRTVSVSISNYIYRTVMDLHSPSQPQVRWLTCQQWGDPAMGKHLSIHEIRSTLGILFDLQLPADATR